MGRARISSFKEDGRYSVSIIKDIHRIEAAIERCAKGIEAQQAEYDRAIEEEASIDIAIDNINTQINNAIRTLEGTELLNKVQSLQDQALSYSSSLQEIKHRQRQATLKALSYQKEKSNYEKISGEEPSEIWCADATDDLVTGAEVGTIEINQEAKKILVAPGGKTSTSNGKLEPGMANEGVATYLNWAVLPGVQRWRPTYRVGTIVEINYTANTCTVCMDDAHSSAQNLRINPSNGQPCDSKKDGPPGFVDFCERNSTHPACMSQGSCTVDMTPDMAATLAAINKNINDNNTYAYDSEKYGRLEQWEEMPQSGGVGDCEDFALAKMRACLDAGIPACALKLATGETSTGDGHAWLEVQTSDVPVALDLNFSQPQDANSLPYSNRVVQFDGMNWGSTGMLLFSVPIEYMSCNAAAFAENDRVVIQFIENDWEKPKVIGFESEPKHCGDIVCIYFPEAEPNQEPPEPMASTFYYDKASVKIYRSKPVKGTSIATLPAELGTWSYFKTFSKPVAINGETYYVFACPASEDDFYFFSTVDWPMYYEQSYEKKYFGLYDPRKETFYEVPLVSDGIENLHTCFGYSDKAFYACYPVYKTQGSVGEIDKIAFQKVGFTASVEKGIVFGDVVTKYMTAEDVANAWAGGPQWANINGLAQDFVDSNGVFHMVYSPYTNFRFAEVSTSGSYVSEATYDIETDSLTIDRLSLPDVGPFQYCTSSVGDIIKKHDAIRYTAIASEHVLNSAINFDGTTLGPLDSWDGSNTIGKSIKIPMNHIDVDGGSLNKKCFYAYTYNVSTYVGDGSGPLSGGFTHDQVPGAIVTPHDVITGKGLWEIWQTRGMAHIERANGDIFQALISTNGDDFCFMALYYNGVRIEEKLATALGVPQKNIIGFIHRPRY